MTGSSRRPPARSATGSTAGARSIRGSSRCRRSVRGVARRGRRCPPARAPERESALCNRGAAALDRVRSHSAARPCPRFCSIPRSGRDRVRSRRPRTCRGSATPSRFAAAPARSATEPAWPRSHRDFRSTRSPKVPATDSNWSASIVRTGSGSAPSTAAWASISSMPSNNSGENAAARTGSRNVPDRCATASSADRAPPPTPNITPTEATCRMRVAKGMSSPPTRGMAGPAPGRGHGAQALLNGAGSPMRRAASRATSQVAVDAASSNRPAVIAASITRAWAATPGPGHTRHECAHDLAAAGEVGEKRHPGHLDVVTEDVRGLHRGRRAPDVLEQGRVDDRTDLLVGTADGSGQPTGDQAPPQRLVQRRAGTEIGRDGKPAQDPEQSEHPTTMTPAERWPQPLSQSCAVRTGGMGYRADGRTPAGLAGPRAPTPVTSADLAPAATDRRRMLATRGHPSRPSEPGLWPPTAPRPTERPLPRGAHAGTPAASVRSARRARPVPRLCRPEHRGW